MYILIIILALALPAIAALFISRIVFNRLIKTGIKYPRIYQVITFIFSFTIIFGAIALLALHNIRIGR
jgi:Na+/H+ antiporter NhaC